MEVRVSLSLCLRNCSVKGEGSFFFSYSGFSQCCRRGQWGRVARGAAGAISPSQCSLKAPPSFLCVPCLDCHPCAVVGIQQCVCRHLLWVPPLAAGQCSPADLPLPITLTPPLKIHPCGSGLARLEGFDQLSAHLVLHLFSETPR